MRTSLLAIALLAGCSPRSSPSQPPGNVATVGAAIQLERDQPLGWIGLGTLRATDNSWIPVSTQVGALTLTDDPLPPRVTVVPRTGAAQLLSVGNSIPLQYGCDNNQLGVRPLSGVRIAAGPAWILPPETPPSWRPAPLALTTPQRTPTHRSHAASTLVFDLVRRDPSRVALTITREGAKVFDSVYERAVMDGADLSAALDLAETVPGIPEPVAGWSFAPAGPFLVVLLVPGYEGVTLQPILIEETSARLVEGMELYLYWCAF
ncbi:MAG: hypothetical protein H0T46_09715 [Deltaproteobacteria bacterium]|nr:hypothetical protein [Deltaproteobacteria bacterium]